MNANKLKIALGCYTDAAHPNGLKMLELDEISGAMSVCVEYPVSNALYQALSPDGAVLYSCTGEGLAAFRCQDMLDKCDDVKLGGCVCHVAAMPDGKRVVFADYLGGFAGSVAVENGRFGEVVMHRHSGSGPNLPRQEKAHCHQVLPLPDGSGYAVCDLGLDEIVTYPEGRIFKTTPAGAGPRHLLFHPNGRLAFLVSELGNLVSSLSWSPAGGFRTLDTLSTLSDEKCIIYHAETQRGGDCRDDFITGALPQPPENLCDLGLSASLREANPIQKTTEANLAAAIRFTPDMNRIVVSNRGENSLVVYDFDSETGRLAFKSRTFLAGSWPRDFMFVSDDLALVAMERSGEVHILRYDEATGDFNAIASLGGLFRPVAFCKCRAENALE